MKNISYKIKIADTIDLSLLDNVCKLMHKINIEKEAPHLYPPDRDFFIKTLSANHLNVAAFDKDNLVGYFSS